MHDAATPPAEQVPGRARALALGALLVLLYLLVQVVAGGVVTAAGGSFSSTGSLGVEAAVAFGAVQLAGVALTVLMASRLGIPWRRLGIGAGSGSAWRGTLALLPVGILVIAPTFGLALAEGEPLLAAGTTIARATAFVSLAVLIAVNEELWFRGVLLDRIGGAHRPVFTTLASAALFGLPHAISLEPAAVMNAGAVTLIVGVPFAAVRLRHGSLVPLILWHALIDTWAFLHEASVVAQGDPTAAEMAAAMVLPALVALGYLAWLVRRSGGGGPAAPPVAERIGGGVVAQHVRGERGDVGHDVRDA